MDDEHFGFYVRCLNHAWLNDGLPESIEEIAQVLGRRAWKVRKLWVKVGICFELFEKRWVNLEQESQRKSAREFVESRRRAAVSRWEQKAAKNSCNARASENECITDAGAMHVECSATASAIAKYNICEMPKTADWESGFADSLRRMFDAHPVPCDLYSATHAYRKTLESSVNPLAVMAFSEKLHAEWCAHWESERKAWDGQGKPPYVPFLAKFFTDGWAAKHPPTQAAPAERKQPQPFRMVHHDINDPLLLAIDAQEKRARTESKARREAQ
jgi:hypothetical protein